MKTSSSTLLVSTLAVSTASAFVITSPPRPASFFQTRQAAPSDPAAQILSIAPTANTCDGADAKFPGECITAADAVQPIISGFAKYGISTAPEQATLLALMAFESGDFKFNKHHFPSENPGQGTRNMMSPSFVLEYATELGVAGTGTTPADALDAVNKDAEMSFGSAAWFYTRKCSDEVKSGVRSGSEAGFMAFNTQCLGLADADVAAEPGRKEYWQKALTALQVSSK